MVLITPEEIEFLRKVNDYLVLHRISLLPEAVWRAPGVIQEAARKTFYFDPRRWRHTNYPGVSGQDGCLNINSTDRVGMLNTDSVEQAMTVLIPIKIWQEPHKVFPRKN